MQDPIKLLQASYVRRSPGVRTITNAATTHGTQHTAHYTTKSKNSNQCCHYPHTAHKDFIESHYKIQLEVLVPSGP